MHMRYTYEKTLSFILMNFIVSLFFTYIIGLSIDLLDSIDNINNVTNELDLVVKQSTYSGVEPTQPPVIKPISHTAQPKKVSNKVDSETYLLAQIISAEAKGEPYEGMIAVGNVILNRVEDPKFPDTIKDVIFQKGQFQPVTNGSIYDKPTDKALQAAKEVMNGKRVVSKRVVFFYNPDISTSRWIFTREVIAEIGNHAFAT